MNKGLRLFGNCHDFNLVEEVDFFQLKSDKLIIFIKLPILNRIDPFEIITLKSLPIKIKGKFYKIGNWGKETSVAVGKRFRAKVNPEKCKKFNRHLYCNTISEFRLKNESQTCIGKIINNDTSVMEYCNWIEVKNMEDIFLKSVSGKFFYSVSNPLKFEVLCINGLENDQFTLDGLGSISIKKGCNAKRNNILLVGTNNYILESTYLIKPLNVLKLELNIPLKVNNNIIDVNLTNRLVTNLDQFSSYNHSAIHYYVINSVMAINMIILVIAIVVVCLKQIYFVERNVGSLMNQAPNISPTVANEQIPMEEISVSNVYDILDD